MKLNTSHRLSESEMMQSTMHTKQDADLAKAITLLHEHVKAYEQSFMNAKKRTTEEMKLYLESVKVIHEHFEPDNLALAIIESTEKELSEMPAFRTHVRKDDSIFSMISNIARPL